MVLYLGYYVIPHLDHNCVSIEIKHVMSWDRHGQMQDAGSSRSRFGRYMSRPTYWRLSAQESNVSFSVAWSEKLQEPERSRPELDGQDKSKRISSFCASNRKHPTSSRRNLTKKSKTGPVMLRNCMLAGAKTIMHEIVMWTFTPAFDRRNITTCVAMGEPFNDDFLGHFPRKRMRSKSNGPFSPQKRNALRTFVTHHRPNDTLSSVPGSRKCKHRNPRGPARRRDKPQSNLRAHCSSRDSQYISATRFSQASS